jgi:deoxyribodipyrimidine photo-lyase
VTGLSPWLTHGVLHVPEVLAALRARGPLPEGHKLVAELGWREFFHHAWRHDGDGIFRSLHAGPRPDAAYARRLPDDVREGRTGVPVIDRAVQTLYATGRLHNHARMWLASYLVHLRHVHWRAGADWLYAHLLDGDLASNHLSWQWVAGTGSAKPYLFNAENVARYAPRDWHSPGTVIDTGYDTMDAIARGERSAVHGPGALLGHDEPALVATPPEGLFDAPDASRVAGRRVWLVHPWSLADPPADADLVVAVADRAFHARWPWDARRWAFVGARLRSLTPLRWCAEAPILRAALSAAREVRGVANLHLGTAFDGLGLAPMPRAFADPPRRCRSFSAFWAAVRGA